MKLYWHNFRKYALSDVRCFGLFFKVIVEVVMSLIFTLKYRQPIDNAIFDKIKKLSPIKY
jgi:hypothetical protein